MYFFFLYLEWVGRVRLSEIFLGLDDGNEHIHIFENLCFYLSFFLFLLYLNVRRIVFKKHVE